MIGVLVLTVASWVLIKFFLKKNLFTIWFTSPRKRSAEVLAAIGISLLAFSIPLVIKSLSYSMEWRLSVDVELGLLINSFYFFFKSILFEELVFRGAILALLVHFLNSRMAILISAISFGVYHWFSYGMFGSGIVPMAYIFIITGSMGFVWAYIYVKTNSIIMPSIIHLLWNFLSSLFLDYQPFGELLFISEAITEYSPLVDFFFQAGGELLSVFLIFGLFQLFINNKKRADLYKPTLS